MAHWALEKTRWSRYQDANPVPTSPLADDIATAPSILYDVTVLYTLENEVLVADGLNDYQNHSGSLSLSLSLSLSVCV